MKLSNLSLVITFSLFLSACGGDSDGFSDSEEAFIFDESSKARVTVDFEGIESSEQKISTYTLSSANQEVSLESANELDLEVNEKAVVALVDEGGEPILFGKKNEGDNEFEVSLSSSAEIFVLYSPRFNGVESSDSKELSNRIKNHEAFSSLVEAIKNAINSGNPCPLNPKCNVKAKYISQDIASDLIVDDLYLGAQ